MLKPISLREAQMIPKANQPVEILRREGFWP
jgi:hypothetical protein